MLYNKEDQVSIYGAITPATPEPSLTVVMRRGRVAARPRRAGCGHFPLLGVASPAMAWAPAP